MGCFQHKYESWNESVKFGDSPLKVVVCDFCKQEFQPNSPNQKRHRRNDIDDEQFEESAACENEQWKASLSPSGYVRQVCGMTVAEFIKEFGHDVFDSL